MSGPMNDDLTNTLNKRADDFARLGGHDLDLAQVVSRAGEIQRGRRMRASIMMAAVVLAVAVPVGVVTLNNSGTDKQPNHIASGGPSGTPNPTESPNSTPTPTIDPDPAPISLDNLGTGQATIRAYYSAGKIHYNGLEVPVDARQVSAVAYIGGGFLVGTYDDQGTHTAAFIDDKGTTVNTWPMGDGGFVVSTWGDVGAFTEPDGTVIAVQDGGSRWFKVGNPLPKGGSYMAEAVYGETCTDRSEVPGCTVWVLESGEKAQVWAAKPNRDPVKVLPGWLRLNDLAGETSAGPPMVAGLISVTDQGSCSEVARMLGDTYDQLWKTCKNTLNAFSPDGRYLLAGPDYLDGPGVGIVTVLDSRTGKTLATIKTDGQTVIPQFVWEDESHILATVQDLSGDGREGLVRIGLDGSRELVGPVVPSFSSGGTGGYVLSR